MARAISCHVLLINSMIIQNKLLTIDDEDNVTRTLFSHDIFKVIEICLKDKID